ncbi:MAG: phosphoglycerate dehydrogenase [Mariprofundaceae bacterium]|nr:phosphoglycerate dehydrogenase [Mariprofundaceae bacterium]
MPKVWIADKMSQRALAIFEQEGIDVDYKPGLSVKEQCAIAHLYDGIAVRSTTQLKAELLEAATRVKVIGRAGIGVDNIDVHRCSERGILVMNTPFGNTITTAELAIAHILAAARQIPQASSSTKAGKWEKSRFMGMELTAKKAGVIGAGNIGAIVCDRLKGLHMHVYVYDPFISDERAQSLGVTKVATVEELCRLADVLTIHVPLLDATRHLIDAKMIAAMKQGSILVNCARGGIVDEDALYEAVASGHLRAGALDVYSSEPAKNNRLFELENMSFTPHIGACSDEAQENVAMQVAQQMSQFLLSNAVSNGINMPSMSDHERQEIEPYTQLCQQLGSFISQSIEPGFSQVQLCFEGHVRKLNRTVLRNAILQGLLSGGMDDVNAFNACSRAKEKGIHIEEVARDRSDHFSNVIQIKLIADSGERTVSGTVFDGIKPRLVSIDHCEIEIQPQGHILLLENKDRPGVVADIGAILASDQINIGDFRLGRSTTKERAIALVTVDSIPSEDIFQALRGLANMISVRYIGLTHA